MSSGSSSYLSYIINWLSSLFFTKNLEICIVGLAAAGKTSLVSSLSNLPFTEDTTPTIAFQLRRVKRGNVVMKIWDLAGQEKFRGIWERYCGGVNAIIYVLDSTDRKNLQLAAQELHTLLQSPSLVRVPLLVLANKNDLEGAAGVEEVIDGLSLGSIKGRAVSCYSTSMKTKHNLDTVIAWLTQRAH